MKVLAALRIMITTILAFSATVANAAPGAQRNQQSRHLEELQSVSAQIEKLRIAPAVVTKALSYRGFPKKAFLTALNFMSEKRRRIHNRRYLGLVDFSKSIAAPRFYIVNLRTGAVGKFHVSHGKGSDPERTGIARTFSNRSGSKASSLGFYLTKDAYYGRFGYSLRLEGLSETNSNVESRAVVLHPYYVGPGYEEIYRRYKGRNCVDGGCFSEGCLGVAHKVAPHIVDNLEDGAIIYAFR